MDSDDDFETGLPKVPQNQCEIKVDLEALRREQMQSFMFEGPGGTQPGGPIFPDGTIGPLMDKETIRQITTPMLHSEDDEKLQVMFGDFEEVEPLMENVTPDGKLKKRILRVGTGKKVQENQIVVAHYILGAEDMDDIIESTYYNKRPRRFRVGAGEVLDVLDVGVRQMKVGEVAKFLATSEYAYGKHAVPVSEDMVIPPDSRVMVRVELLEAYSFEKDDSIFHMSPAERRGLSFESLYKHALQIKGQGNREFKVEEYGPAAKLYVEALEIISDLEPITEDEKSKYLQLRQQLCNNLAQTYCKLEKYKRALKYAEDGINLPLKNALKAKSYYWCGRAQYQLGNLSASLSHLEKGYEMRADKDIMTFMQEVKEKIKISAHEEKKICERMFAANISD